MARGPQSPVAAPVRGAPRPRDPVLVQVAGAWRQYLGCQGALAAHGVTEVLPALHQVEAALAAGLHAVGYLAYEAAPAFDPVLVTRPPADLPLLWFGLFERWQPAAPACDREPPALHWQPTVGRLAYAAAIDRIKAWIAAGDTYQVNYTLRLRAAFDGDPWPPAVALWQAQRADYGAWLDLGDLVIASASPELFLSRDGAQLTSRPMKGTAPRGRTLAEDEQQAAALAASVKDRAENLMILDMIRNDLGRIAAIGSVRVPARFAVERYDQVWQLTSTVTARSQASLTTLLTALYPCASITGAPKVRTMQLIRDLEPDPRGVYTGSVAVLEPGGRAQLNVAIRTIVFDRRTGVAEYGVGGGIVWDSTAEAEWQECRTKALALTRRRPAFELLETLLWEPDRGLLLGERHLARLQRSAAYFGFVLDLAVVRAALAEVSGAAPLRVRLLCAEDGGVRVETAPFEAGPARVWRVGLAPAPVDSSDRFLFHKTTRREVYDAARAAWPAADDVLLHNERGEVTEATIANVAFWIDGALVTPPVDCGLLPGVYRELALERGWLRERVVTVAEARQAERCFLLNSVRRWVEARLEGDAPA